MRIPVLVAVALAAPVASAQIVFTPFQATFNNSFDAFQGTSGYDDGSGFGVTNASGPFPNEPAPEDIGGGTSGGIIDDGVLVAYTYSSLSGDFTNTSVVDDMALGSATGPSTLSLVARREIFFAQGFDPSQLDDPAFNAVGRDLDTIGYTMAVFFDYFFTIQSPDPVPYTLLSSLTTFGETIPDGVIDLDLQIRNITTGEIVEAGSGFLSAGEYTIESIRFNTSYTGAELGLASVVGTRDFLSGAELRLDLVLPSPSAAALLGAGVICSRRRRVG